jgi:DNA adenine methylase
LKTNRHSPWAASCVLDKPTELHDEKFFDRSVISPLRYPGSKRGLVSALGALIEANIPPPRLFVEPFCGGASAALRLCGTGQVEHIVLADANPLISAFWHVAAFDTRWLVDQMHSEDVTLARWDYWRAKAPRSRRDRAAKALFLNRTSFSGILHEGAGPIGGRGQKSTYKIDCRYGRTGLEQRIRAVGDLADTGRLLDVWNLDWQDTLKLVSDRYAMLDRNEILIYLDPPYVDKAPRLYEWSFESAEHQAFAGGLHVDARFLWVLSYDNSALARKLHLKRRGLHALLVPIRYTATSSANRGAKKELLITNFEELSLPKGSWEKA